MLADDKFKPANESILNKRKKERCYSLLNPSVFVASQSSCFFLCVRTNSPSGKQALLNAFESNLARTEIEFLTQILT